MTGESRYRFDQETRLQVEDDGRWTGHLSGAWNIGDNPNGGYLLSVALGAMARSLPHPDPVSVTTHYLRPGEPDAAVEVEVDVVREGRSLSTARATLSQGGKARISVLAAFGDLATPAGVDADVTLDPPDLPMPEDCVLRSGETQGVHLPILERLETRLHPQQARAGSAGEPVVSGWIRFTDGRPPDTLSLPLFTDTFPPSPLGLLGVVGWVPTIELTVHVRRRPAPGWIRGRFRTDDLHEGRMIESGALWDSSGALVAQCRQLGLVTAKS